MLTIACNVHPRTKLQHRLLRTVLGVVGCCITGQADAESGKYVVHWSLLTGIHVVASPNGSRGLELHDRQIEVPPRHSPSAMSAKPPAFSSQGFQTTASGKFASFLMVIVRPAPSSTSCIHLRDATHQELLLIGISDLSLSWRFNLPVCPHVPARHASPQMDMHVEWQQGALCPGQPCITMGGGAI